MTYRYIHRDREHDVKWCTQHDTCLVIRARDGQSEHHFAVDVGAVTVPPERRWRLP